MTTVEISQAEPPTHANLTNSGLGSTLAQVSITFIIFVPRNGHSRLFMRHGAPSRADWWKSCKPLRVHADPDALRQIIDDIAGVEGAYRAFPLIAEV